MPNKSSRINKTPHNDMNNILLILNSLNPKANPEEHPKLFVIFNDVSIEEKFDDKDYRDRIQVYKQGLKDFVKGFYLKKSLHDETKIGKQCWLDVKEEVCSSEDYIDQPWFKELDNEEKDLIEVLKTI